MLWFFEKLKSLTLIHKGRVGRLEFIFGLLIVNAVIRPLAFVQAESLMGYIIMFVILFFGYISFSLIAKRFRDIGLSGWFVLLFIVALFTSKFLLLHYPVESSLADAFLLFITLTIFVLFLWPGQKRDNKYGAYKPYRILDRLKRIVE